MTEQIGKWKGEAEAVWMISWAFPVVTTVWGLKPVVWVVTVNGHGPLRHSSKLPKSQEEPVLLGEVSWEGPVWLLRVLAMSTLCCVSTSGMRSLELHWRNYAEKQPLGMFINGRILFQGRLKSCESSVKASAPVCSAGWCRNVYLGTEKSSTWLLQGASLPQDIPSGNTLRAGGTLQVAECEIAAFSRHRVIWMCAAGGLSKVCGVDGWDQCWQQTWTLKKGSLRIHVIVTETILQLWRGQFLSSPTE